MSIAQQSCKRAFYLAALKGELPSQSGEPLTENELAQLSLDSLAMDFFCGAYLGTLPSAGRWYLNFNGMSYGKVPTIEYDPSIVDSFEFECNVLATSTSDFQTLTSSSDLSDFFRLTSISTNPVMAVSLGGIENGLLIGVSVNTLHNIKITYTDSTYTVTVEVDGVVQGSLQMIGWQGLTKTFSYYGALGFGGGGTGQYLEGIGFDVKFSQPSNTDVYPNPPFWPIANGYTDSHITPDVNNPDGDEIVVNGDFSDGVNGWAEIGITVDSVVAGESVTITGAANTDRLAQQAIPVVAGKSYKISTSVIDAGAANGEIVIWESDFSSVLDTISGDSDGAIVTPSTSAITVWYRANAGTATFGTLSVKQTTAMQLFNDLPEDWVEE